MIAKVNIENPKKDVIQNTRNIVNQKWITMILSNIKFKRNTQWIYHKILIMMPINLSIQLKRKV